METCLAYMTAIYRNDMPHPSTGRTLVELMIKRQIRMRPPELRRQIDETVYREAKAQERKTRYDRKNKVQGCQVKTRNKIIIKQEKTWITEAK